MVNMVITTRKETCSGGGVQLLSTPTLSMLMNVVQLDLFDNILTILQHYMDTNHSGLGC